MAAHKRIVLAIAFVVVLGIGFVGGWEYRRIEIVEDVRTAVTHVKKEWHAEEIQLKRETEVAEKKEKEESKVENEVSAYETKCTSTGGTSDIEHNVKGYTWRGTCSAPASAGSESSSEPPQETESERTDREIKECKEKPESTTPFPEGLTCNHGSLEN